MNRIRSRLEGVFRTLREDGTLRNVLKNASWLTGSSGAITLLSILQGMLTARILGVVVWGALGIALSMSGVVGKLLSFRMQDFVVKWVTHLKSEGDGLETTAFKLAVAADATTACLAFVAVELLAAWGAAVFAKNSELVWVFRLIGVTALLQAGRESMIGILHANRDFKAVSLVQAVCQTVSVCGIAVVFLFGGGLLGVVAVLVGVETLAAVLTWTFGLRAAHAILPAGWALAPLRRLGDLGREMMRFAIMVNISGTLRATMNDADLLILGFLTNPAQVAYYKLAKSICQIAQLPMMPMVNASFPELSTAAAEHAWAAFRRLLRRSSKVAALWVIPVSIGLVVLAPYVIALLYGPAFVPAVPALAVLLVGVCFDGVLFWTGAALLSLGDPGYLTTVNLAAALAKLTLVFLLVPTGGYVMFAALWSLVLIGSNLLYARRALTRIATTEATDPA